MISVELDVLHSENNKLKNKNRELEQKLKAYESGFKGACPTCEAVGELNVELQKKLSKAVEVIVSISNLEQVNKNEQPIIWYTKLYLKARQFLKELGE